MANLTDTTKFRQINSETLMYNADNVDTLINGLSATYANKTDVYTKNEVYTKGEVDAKVTSVYHFKGSVETFDDLLSVQNPAVGDTYNVSDTGKNYAWTGDITTSAYEQGWDALGGIFDLEDYYTCEEIDGALSGKVDKVEGMGLSHNDFTDSLATKLNNIAASAQVNVIETVKVDNVALPVNDKAVNITLSGKVDKVAGMGLSHNDFTDEAVAKVNGALQTSGGTVLGDIFVKTRQGDTTTIITDDRFYIFTSGQNRKETQYQNGQIFFDNGVNESTISLPSKSGTIALTSDIDSAVSGKVDKVAGMGLSHNDFTDSDVSQLSQAYGFTVSGGLVPGREHRTKLGVGELDINYVYMEEDGFHAGYHGDTETIYQDGYISRNDEFEFFIELPSTSGTLALTSDINSAVSGKVDRVAGMGLSHEDFTSAFKAKLTSIASGAEVNQNAFSNVKVGNVTVAATGKTDTVELVAGTNVTLTPDSTNKKITITAASTDISGKADKTSFATLKNLQKVTPNDFDLDDLVTKYNAMVDILKAIGSALNPSA